MAKPNFVAKAAPVPDAAPSSDTVVANNIEDPPPAIVIDPAQQQVPAKEAAPPPLPQALKKTAPATPHAKKESSGTLQGQGGPRID